MGQRQVLLNDFLLRQSGSRMTLTDAGMTGEALGAHHLCPDESVTEIRLRAETADLRGVATADTDIVEHRRLFHEATVEMQFGMSVTNLQRPLRDERGVNHQNIPKPVGLGIILFYDFVIIHSCYMKVGSLDFQTSPFWTSEFHNSGIPNDYFSSRLI